MRCEHSHWNSHVHIWISVQLRAVNKPLLFICAIHNSNAISRVRPFVFYHSYFLHQLTFGLDLLASVWVMTITRQGAKVERPSDVVLLLADRPERTGGALPRRRLRPALQQRARACVASNYTARWRQSRRRTTAHCISVVCSRTSARPPTPSAAPSVT